jgi:hypothetical protein
LSKVVPFIFRVIWRHWPKENHYDFCYPWRDSFCSSRGYFVCHRSHGPILNKEIGYFWFSWASWIVGRCRVVWVWGVDEVFGWRDTWRCGMRGRVRQWQRWTCWVRDGTLFGPVTAPVWTDGDSGSGKTGFYLGMAAGAFSCRKSIICFELSSQ